MEKLRKNCSEIYFDHYVDIKTVDEMGVAELVVDEMGVDEMGSRRSGNKRSLLLSEMTLLSYKTPKLFEPYNAKTTFIHTCMFISLLKSMQK